MFLQEKAQMDALVEELQQQLTRLPLQQRARSYTLHFFPPTPTHTHAPICGANCICAAAASTLTPPLPHRFAKAATKATSVLSEKVVCWFWWFCS